MVAFRQIFQEMAAEKVRLGLTILAVAWATLAIATMLATGEGLRLGLMRTSESGSGDLIIVNGGMASVNNGVFRKGEWLKLDISDVTALQALPSVKTALPVANWNESVTHNKQGTWQQPLGVTESYQKLMGFKIMAGGRWFNQFDGKQRRNVIVLGYSAAIDLFNHKSGRGRLRQVSALNVDPIGKIVKVGKIDFQVIGVLQPSSADVGQGIPMDYAIFVPLQTWQGFNPYGSISAIDVAPNPTINRTLVAQTLRQVITLKHGASMTDKQVVQVTDMLLRQKTMLKFLMGLQLFLGVIGLVTLMVAGIGIANVMYATVKRATKDIGVRMAIGATPSDIRRHYLVQSLMTMALGGGIGVILTYGLVTVIHFLPLDGNRLFESLGKPMPVLNIWALLIVAFALSLVGIASAWFPARNAASITPLEALRND